MKMALAYFWGKKPAKQGLSLMSSASSSADGSTTNWKDTSHKTELSSEHVRRLRNPQWQLYSCNFTRQFATQGLRCQPREVALSSRVWLPIPVGNWSPSLNSAYSQYCASALTDSIWSAIFAQGYQCGGIRLDFCVRSYTNRENIISFPMSLKED